MESPTEYRVSDRGQMALPASARRRWHLMDGGHVQVVDLGDAVVIMPGPATGLQQLLGEAIDEAGGYARLVQKVIDDEPDLA